MAINIKPENRGKFNATKKRTGKTTEQLTHSKNPLTRKRAIFAQNAKKWKHADGGNLFYNGGPDGENKWSQSQDYAYINDVLTPMVQNSPSFFWSDDPKAKEAREWAHRNYPQFVDWAYENTPEEIRKGISSKKLTKSTIQKNYMEDFGKRRDEYSKGSLGVIGAGVGTGLAAGLGGAGAVATAPTWMPVVGGVGKTVLAPFTTIGEYVGGLTGLSNVGTAGAALDTGLGAYFTAKAADDLIHDRGNKYANAVFTALPFLGPFMQGSAKLLSKTSAGKKALEKASKGLEKVFNWFRDEDEVAYAAQKLGQQTGPIQERGINVDSDQLARNLAEDEILRQADDAQNYLDYIESVAYDVPGTFSPETWDAISEARTVVERARQIRQREIANGTWEQTRRRVFGNFPATVEPVPQARQTTRRIPDDDVETELGRFLDENVGNVEPGPTEGRIPNLAETVREPETIREPDMVTSPTPANLKYGNSGVKRSVKSLPPSLLPNGELTKWINKGNGEVSSDRLKLLLESKRLTQEEKGVISNMLKSGKESYTREDITNAMYEGYPRLVWEEVVSPSGPFGDLTNYGLNRGWSNMQGGVKELNGLPIMLSKVSTHPEVGSTTHFDYKPFSHIRLGRDAKGNIYAVEMQSDYLQHLGKLAEGPDVIAKNKFTENSLRAVASRDDVKKAGKFFVPTEETEAVIQYYPLKDVLSFSDENKQFLKDWYSKASKTSSDRYKVRLEVLENAFQSKKETIKRFTNTKHENIDKTLRDKVQQTIPELEELSSNHRTKLMDILMDAYTATREDSYYNNFSILTSDAAEQFLKYLQDDSRLRKLHILKEWNDKINISEKLLKNWNYDFVKVLEDTYLKRKNLSYFEDKAYRMADKYTKALEKQLGYDITYSKHKVKPYDLYYDYEKLADIFNLNLITKRLAGGSETKHKSVSPILNRYKEQAIQKAANNAHLKYNGIVTKNGRTYYEIELPEGWEDVPYRELGLGGNLFNWGGGTLTGQHMDYGLEWNGKIDRLRAYNKMISEIGQKASSMASMANAANTNGGFDPKADMKNAQQTTLNNNLVKQTMAGKSNPNALLSQEALNQTRQQNIGNIAPAVTAYDSMQGMYNTSNGMFPAGTFADGGQIRLGINAYKYNPPKERGNGFENVVNGLGINSMMQDMQTNPQQMMSTFGNMQQFGQNFGNGFKNMFNGAGATAAAPKACGGKLHAYGGDFSNGQTMYNTGGTHEENPYEGVQVGTDNQGTPNLVEEGEVRYKDYIFSNRLTLSEELADKYSIPKKYVGATFAYIAEKMGDYSREREFDPIAKRGLEIDMYKLQNAHEEARILKAQEEQQEKIEQMAAELGVTPEEVQQAMMLQQQAQQDQEQQQQMSPEEMAMMQQQQAEQMGQMPQQEQYAEQEIPADYASGEAPYAFGGKLRAYGGPDGEPTFLERMTGKQRPDYTYPEEPVYNGGELSPVTVEAERTWGKSPYDVSYDTTEFTGNPFTNYLSYSLAMSNSEVGSNGVSLEPNWLQKLDRYINKTVREFDASEVRKELVDNMNKELEKQAKKYNMTVSKFRGTPMGRKIRYTYQQYANKAVNEMFPEKQKAYALGGTLFDYPNYNPSNPQPYSTLFDNYANVQNVNKFDMGIADMMNPDPQAIDPIRTNRYLNSKQLSRQQLWNKYTRESLLKIMRDFEAQYNAAESDEEKAKLRSDFIKRFNAVQESYATMYQKGVDPKVANEIVEAHQIKFGDFGGNYGYGLNGGIEQDLNNAGRTILKDTTKEGYTPDGLRQIITDTRHLGTNAYDKELLNFYNDVDKELNDYGIKYSLLNRDTMKYNFDGNDYELYGLSEFSPEPVARREQDVLPAVKNPLAPKTPQQKIEEGIRDWEAKQKPTTNSTNPQLETQNPGNFNRGRINPNYSILDFVPLYQYLTAGHPDYYQPDSLVDYTNRLPNPTYKPIGDFMQYHPFDRQYAANQQRARTEAQIRNNWNTSGGNRGYAGAMNLATNMQAQLADAEMQRQADAANQAQNLQVSTFNRGTNQYNAEAFNRLQLSLPQMYNLGLQARSERARQHYMIDKDFGTSKSTNLNTWLKNMYDRRREAQDRAQVQWLAQNGVLGNFSGDYPYPESPTFFDSLSDFLAAGNWRKFGKNNNNTSNG